MALDVTIATDGDVATQTREALLHAPTVAHGLLIFNELIRRAEEPPD